MAGRRHLRRAGLRVPAHELREVAFADVGEALHELLDGRGLAVVALEIEVHAFAELLRPEQRLDHAHDLGALLVDRRGVEVVDLAIELRPHRMGERAGVLDELAARASPRTSPIRVTARERWSEVNSWSRKTVRPSFRQSWNQSRQVMRLPVQLWKYSCAMMASIDDEVVVGRGLG